MNRAYTDIHPTKTVFNGSPVIYKKHSEYMFNVRTKFTRCRPNDGIKHFFAKIKNFLLGKGFATNRDLVYSKFLKHIDTKHPSRDLNGSLVTFEGDRVTSVTDREGNTYIGHWVDGVRQGKGELHGLDNTVYTGEFSRGKKDGIGIETTPDREKKRVIYNWDKKTLSTDLKGE